MARLSALILMLLRFWVPHVLARIIRPRVSVSSFRTLPGAAWIRSRVRSPRSLERRCTRRSSSTTARGAIASSVRRPFPRGARRVHAAARDARVALRNAVSSKSGAV